MKKEFSRLDITFSIDSRKFYVNKIAYGCAYQIVQSHSHGNGCYEIHFIPSGQGRAIIDDILYNLSPGTLYVTGPHVEHSQISDKDNPIWEYCIYIYVPNAAYNKDASNISDIFLRNKFWFGSDTQDIITTLDQLFSEFERKQLGYQQQIELLLGQLVIKLVRNYEKNKTSGKKYLPSNLQERSSQLIEDHFLFEYQNSKLEDLAAQLGLSRRQTQRFLKEHYGKTYIQKRIDARMSMASTLLIETDLSISEISIKLGFATAEYFSSTFKNYFGINAKDYRKKYH
ncbi:AraC family transcriptional regulator [Lachnospiraceae bacterium OttesenSCG-928-D06]|nr:AraC family transcriptional regulator [Lachnospiraceae bacterium OttesenSCG-928-D06]